MSANNFPKIAPRYLLVARNIDPPIRKILQRIIITIPKIKLFQNIINFYK